MRFRKAPALTVALLVLFSFTAYGQTGFGYLYYKNYYYDYKVLNPAFAGMKDKHMINAVFSGVKTGPSYGDSRCFMVYGTYETSIPSIKSGIGALTAYDEFGVISTFQNSIFFSKKLSFTDHSGLRVGTRLTYLRTVIDYTKYQYLHKDDPLLADKDGHDVTNRFNFDLGVLYYSPIVNVGVSIRDVLKEEYVIINKEVWSITSFNAMLSHEFEITSDLKITPSVVYINDFEENFQEERIDINSIFEIRQWLILGAGYSIMEGDNNISFNAGVNIKDWLQIISHVYWSGRYRYDISDPNIEAMIRVNIPHRKAKE